MSKHRLPELLLPVGIIGCLLVIFMPLPTAIMDVLLAANIAIAVIVLLTTIYVGRPLELSVFPSLLLATTLARLALNVGTTRLILTRGAIDHEQAAGGVVQGFASFVTGDSLTVGFVIFAIIVVIQFVVITKGATRISEVTARFSLDGMPGRQMAIDADLNAGVIDAKQAQQRREEVIAQADFYGAMDGASKFVRGDAVAGLIITAINIVGGLAIGLSSNMSIGKAAQTFTSLTIGDGLVSQLPALLISLATGVLVTRCTRKSNLPGEVVGQVFARPIVLVVTAVFLGILVVTELPKLPLLALAGGCLLTAWTLNKRPLAEPQANGTAATPAANTIAPPAEPTLGHLLAEDPVAVELGIDLIQLADVQQGGQLLPLINETRGQLAAELGIILPKVRVHDNLRLSPTEYRILIKGNVVEQAELSPENFLAIDNLVATEPLETGAIVSMAAKTLSSKTAYWIAPTAAASAKEQGYDVRTADEVLAKQLKQAVRAHATTLLTRDAMVELIEQTRKTSPAVVEELIPGPVSMGKIQKILRGLLVEGISIRPLALILETIGDHAESGLSASELVEKVRIQLAANITASLKTGPRQPIPVFTIAQDLQDRIACGFERLDDQIRIDLPRSTIESLASSLDSAAASMRKTGRRPVVLVDQGIRPVIAELAAGLKEDLFVLGQQERDGHAVEHFGEVTIEQLTALAAA